MKRFILFPVFFLGLFCRKAKGQPVQWNAAQIKQHLEKLNVLGSVLFIAAHPDDENTRLLAYLSNGKLYRTAYLSCTRGDGGQNLIGDEQGEQLGLIRTQELLAARRIDGAEQYFTTANDFGFSKSATETLNFWDHDRVLGNMVWVIRQYKPDILICRFPEDSRAGHGHHWASAILAHEAFSAAADPKRFPEQLKYVQPWQAKRLLWNTFRFGGNNTTSADQFHIPVGGYNALLGKSYGEIAAQSRSMHKSQGFGSSPSRTDAEEYFTTIVGDPPKTSLLDGVNTTWSRISNGAVIEGLIKHAIETFSMDRPESSLPELLKIYTTISALPNGYWKTQKLEEAQKLIVSCLGLFVEANASNRVTVPGQSLPIHIQFVNRSNIAVSLESLNIEDRSIPINQPLQQGEALDFNEKIQVSDTASITEPYWLMKDHPLGYYNVTNPQLIGRPENKPPYTIEAVIRINGQDIKIKRVVQYKYTDNVKGEIYEPLVIAPPVIVSIPNEVHIYKDQTAQIVQVKLSSFIDDAQGVLHLKVPSIFSVVQNDLPFHLGSAGTDTVINFKVALKNKVDSSKSYSAIAIASYQGKQYDRDMETIAHDHIPTITLFPKAATKLVAIDLKTQGMKIGYIAGAADKVPEALREAGYEVTFLNSAEITEKQLSGYDAIITGIRAYNTNPMLAKIQKKLLLYVYNGGTLLVQYNKNERTVTDQLGPYPFRITGNRVTEENATVTMLAPQNDALNFPNKITSRDFDNWIQERGLYFLGDIDARYQKLFSMHDKDSEPLDGATIIGNYGKGRYVYTCLDFFRDLPAGVPGAYRLFVNFISKRK